MTESIKAKDLFTAGSKQFVTDKWYEEGLLNIAEAYRIGCNAFTHFYTCLPEFPQFLRERFFNRGGIRKAVEEYKAAQGSGAEIKKAVHSLFLNYFFLYEQLGVCFRYDELEPLKADFAEKIKNTPDSDILRFSLGAIFCLCGQFQKAKECFNHVNNKHGFGPFDFNDLTMFIDTLPGEPGAWDVLKLKRKQKEIWQKENFTAYEAHTWQKTGYTLDEAVHFRSCNLSAEQVIDWKNTDIPVAEVTSWINLKIYPPEALPWHQQGFSGEDAEEWIKKGISPKDAREWGDSGFTPRDYLRLAKNVTRRLDLEEALAWRKTGFSIDDMVKWFSEGVIYLEQALDRIERRRAWETAEKESRDRSSCQDNKP